MCVGNKLTKLLESAIHMIQVKTFHDITMIRLG